MTRTIHMAPDDSIYAALRLYVSKQKSQSE